MIKRNLFAALAFMAASTSVAQTPELGIVKKTDCGFFWRYDFNYSTTDVDGVTPITLSAAIFMSSSIHENRSAARGCALINHYTITSNADRPTNVSRFDTLEGLISSSNYFLIESDGFGFGIDSLRNQKYLQGLGYSQGGHSGMWVNRLVAEGYRSDELPKIDYSILGGGPYDMYQHYCKLLNEDKSQYPVALPLILSGMIDAGGNKVKNEDIFTDDVVAVLPSLFDSKQYDTDHINDYFYDNFGGNKDEGIEMSKIVKEAFFQPEKEPMSDIVYHLKENSLVYDTWAPNKTDSITFVHSPADEVVPYLNQESMEQHLKDVGYTAFDIDSSSDFTHTETGTLYVFKVALTLSEYIPTGMEEHFRNTPGECLHDIYSIDGKLIHKNAKMSKVYPTLPKGIYVVKGRKIVKK